MNEIVLDTGVKNGNTFYITFGDLCGNHFVSRYDILVPI
ncbi:hypothetical protein Stok01_00523 [Sulfurisphaera tokodaii]